MMNPTLFDRLVENALESNRAYASLRPVIEKEILHNDILREMNNGGYLKALTFIGGTCLRKCYHSERLSEDLDFSGGFHFTKKDFDGLRPLLIDTLQKKYGFTVSVSEPELEKGNTDTWKIKIITRPERPDFPAQRINIDVCMLPSYERRPAMLQDHYDLTASALILYAESLTEILADKIIAFALRPNRIKNRDLWDIVWLSSRSILLSRDLLSQKLADRKITAALFKKKYTERLGYLKDKQEDFLAEMRRFLSPVAFNAGLTDALWWEHLLVLLCDFSLN
jgi:predicted nucleotidyltransferase component of viral defense system